MKRTRNEEIPSEKADAIFTADWHFREDTPTCYKGDFQEEQWAATDFVSALQREHACPVIHAGDLFHHWKPSPYLLSQAIKHLPKDFYTVYGQHDLPQHNLELVDKCGINTLKAAGVLTVLDGYHYGQTPNKGGLLGANGIIICVWHHMTYIIPPFPGATGGQAEGLLRKYPQYDVIVTGDNHQSFYDTYEGRLLVNPGSLTRQSAIQIDFRPRVFLWYAATNTVVPVYLPIKKDVISREHIEVIEQRNARIDAFISKLGDDWQASMSFEDNLELFCDTNKIAKPVKEIIYKALEHD